VPTQVESKARASPFTIGLCLILDLTGKACQLRNVLAYLTSISVMKIKKSFIRLTPGSNIIKNFRSVVNKCS
jgi:hypothetical protein